jgi:hypothetical protein
MRARRAVYPVIQDLRSQLNGCPMHEPRTLPPARLTGSARNRTETSPGIRLLRS